MERTFHRVLTCSKKVERLIRYHTKRFDCGPSSELNELDCCCWAVDFDFQSVAWVWLLVTSLSFIETSVPREKLSRLLF